MMDHFSNDEVQELLGEDGIQSSAGCQGAKSLDLAFFSPRICWWQPVLGLEHADSLRAFETLGEQVHQRSIDIVDRPA